jgi:hypothetical protein
MGASVPLSGPSVGLDPPSNAEWDDFGGGARQLAGSLQGRRVRQTPWARGH